MTLRVSFVHKGVLTHRFIYCVSFDLITTDKHIVIFAIFKDKSHKRYRFLQKEFLHLVVKDMGFYI